MTGIFLKDGARMVNASGELVEDFARQAIRATAEKVFRSAEKKFSRMTFGTQEGEISVWDFYCQGCFRNGSAFRVKLIADFIRMSLVRHINGMSEEMRWLIEMSACSTADVEENEVLSREIVLAVILAEITGLVLERGRSVLALPAEPDAPHHSTANGASPA